MGHRRRSPRRGGVRRTNCGVLWRRVRRVVRPIDDALAPCVWRGYFGRVASLCLGPAKLSVIGFIDGAKRVEHTVSAACPIDFSELRIGDGTITNAVSWSGWVDEFRITKGLARWTAAFDPSDAGDYASMGGYTDSANVMYRNKGDGSFEDKSAYAGVGGTGKGRALSLIHI